MAGDITFRNMMLGDDAPQKVAPDFYEKEGEAYTKLGGREGKSDYKKAFVDGPRELEQAILDAEKAQTQKSKELGKVYDAEQERSAMAMAANNHRREADQQALAQRQAQLEKATQFYTDDLADQGKFWTNPGNIMSAIAYSLTPIFGNDNTSGIKLINQAIDRDMANRQHAAAQTLGALQSNLAGYHKLAGDKEAGDLLADSEARRLAAQEVARISQKFESPISQAKAQAVIQDLRQKSLIAKMEAHRLFVHIDPSKMPQALHNARASGFDGSYQDYNSQKPGVDPTTANVSGFVDGTPTTASPTGGTKNGKWDGFSSPTVAAVVKADPKAAYKAVLDGRLNGAGDIAEMLRRQVAAEAARSVPPGATPDHIFKAKRDIVNRWEAERKEAPELVKAAPKIAATRSIQSKIDIIERSEAARGEDPRKFLESARNTPGIPSDWVDRYEKWKIRTANGTKPGSAEDYEQLKAQAKQLFRQQMNELVNNYIHDNAGGAVSESEAKRMNYVISQDAGMPEIKAFVRNQSEKAKYEESVALAKMSPGAALYYKLRTAGGNFSLDAPGRPGPKTALPLNDSPNRPIGPNLDGNKLPNSPLNPDFIGPR
jgi:hypothetical protein